MLSDGWQLQPPLTTAPGLWQRPGHRGRRKRVFHWGCVAPVHLPSKAGAAQLTPSWKEEGRADLRLSPENSIFRAGGGF